MARLPAICEKCNSIFASSIELIDPGSIYTKSCSAGPCPKCGGDGIIPDGMYTTLTTTAALLANGNISRNQIEDIIQTLKQSIKNGIESASLSEILQRDHPEISKVADLLPKTRNELYLFLTVLITLATLLLDKCSSSDSPPIINQNNLEIIINEAIEKTIEVNITPKSKSNTKVSSRNKTKKKRINKIAKNSRKKNRR